MEEQGGLYSPERYRQSTPITNFQRDLGLPQVSQPTSTNGIHDGEQSPGMITVATVEQWPRFTDYQPTADNGARALPTYNSMMTAESPGARADRSKSIGAMRSHSGERTTRGTMNLLAMADIRIRSRYPIQVLCPHCSMDVVTMIVPKRGAAVYCGCVLMTLVGLCCIPFMLPSMQDIQHFCPHCSQLIGISTPL